MFNKGVPEKSIAEKLGHFGLDGLRAYVHPFMKLERAVGDIIMASTKQFIAHTEEAVKKQDPVVLLTAVPSCTILGFSGSMANCTYVSRCLYHCLLIKLIK